jgi:hypothetical protein
VIVVWECNLGDRILDHVAHEIRTTRKPAAR